MFRPLALTLLLLGAPFGALTAQPRAPTSEKDSLDALWSGLDGYRSYLQLSSLRMLDSLGTQPPAQYRAKVLNTFRTKLDAAARIIPGDPWIAGMRYRMGATDAVEDCLSSAWFCSALKAYASSARLDFLGADSAYSTALAAMPADQRCAWSDVSMLMTKDFAARAEAMECARRDTLAATVWGLADPLYSTAGNERRVEHYARWTYLTLDIGARAALCFPGGPERLSSVTAMDTTDVIVDLDGVRDVVVRLGVPVFWDANQPQLASDILPAIAGPLTGPDTASRGKINTAANVRARQASIAAFPGGLRAKLAAYPSGASGCPDRSAQTPLYHHPVLEKRDPPRYHFVPSTHAIEHPLDAVPQDWTIADRGAPELYDPPPPDTIVELDYQVAYFQRPREGLLIAATDIMESRVLAPTVGAQAYLSVNEDPARSADLWSPVGVSVFRWAVPAPATRSIVGIEIRARDAVGRARLTAGPRPSPLQHLAVSDLVFLGQGMTQFPGTIEEAIPLVAGTTRVNPGSIVPLMWEVYGLVARDSVTYSLSARRTSGPGAVGAVARAVGLGGSADSVSVRWNETVVTSAERAARGVNLDARTLAEGTYALELSISSPGQASVTTTQTLRVARREER